MNITTAIGLAAATGTTFSFVPQAIKTWKSKQTHDISLPMYVMFVVGVTLWLIYGLINSDLPVILANALTLMFAAAILGLKIRYG